MSGALIPRRVFAELKEQNRNSPWFHMEHDAEGHLRGTEDIWFWRKVKAAGYDIKAHLYLTADHIKLWRLGLL